MTPKQIKDLRDRRAAALAAATAINVRAAGEDRSFTPEETTEFEARMSEAAELETRAQNAERVNTAAAAGGSPGAPLPHQDAGNTRNGRHGYSVLRCLQRRLDGLALDGLEGETHQEIEGRSERKAEGMYIPILTLPNLRAGQAGREHRTALLASNATGAIGDTVSPEMIDVLRARMLTAVLGATVLNGLNGPVSIPKKTAAAGTQWIDESTDGTEQTITLGEVALTPKTLRTHTAYGRKLMKQTSVDIEALVREDLAMALAIGLDKAALNGSGSGAEPTGLLQMSDVLAVALGTNGLAPTWDLAVQMKEGVDGSNALTGSLAYLTSPAGLSKLERTPRVSGQPIYIADDMTQAIGRYSVQSTSHMPSNLTKGSGTNLSAMLFGDWSSLLIATWGATDVIFNPYSEDSKGRIRITLLQESDVKVRTAESFRKCVDMVTT